jgi:hypothetical protein
MNMDARLYIGIGEVDEQAPTKGSGCIELRG